MRSVVGSKVSNFNLFNVRFLLRTQCLAILITIILPGAFSYAYGVTDFFSDLNRYINPFATKQTTTENPYFTSTPGWYDPYKQLSCSREKGGSKFGSRSPRRCTIENQAITDPWYNILDTPDSFIEAFYIDNDKSVKFIPENIGEKFPNVFTFHVVRTGLTSIGAKDFKNLQILKEIELNDNEIERVNRHTFKYLLQLEHINLASNKIRHLSADVFSDQSQLKQLLLQQNEIEFIDEKIFANLIELRQLSLSENKLFAISKNQFKNNRVLEKIWLDKNRIKAISSTTFDGLYNLELINMDGNSCVSSHWYSNQFNEMKNYLQSHCRQI